MNRRDKRHPATTYEHSLSRTFASPRRVLVGLAMTIGLGFRPALTWSEPMARVAAEQVSNPQQTSDELSSAAASQLATRRAVKPSLTANRLPVEVSDTISGMVTAVGGCTRTQVGDSIVTAAHCHPSGFAVDGDVAWDGAKPEWVDPSRIAAGATIYAVGYPRASPGPQAFTLTTLGIRTVPMEGRSIDVLMAFGDGVPCTPGSSGMIAWVTLDNLMVPIGPMSVYSIDPAITGLPRGQYVCGFAV